MKDRLFAKNLKTTDRLLAVLIILFAVFFGVWLYLLMKDPSGSQRGILFIDEKDFFMDWFNTVYYTVGRKPYAWGIAEDRNYAPIVYMLLYPFSKLYPYDLSEGMTGEGRYLARYAQLPIVGAVIFLIACYLLLFYVLYKFIRREEHKKLLILALLFLSGVSFNSIERMNIQILTSASLFIYVYFCDREILPGKAKTFIGLSGLAFAAALKLFPAIFGILLLYKKRWKEAVIAFVLGVLIVILPFFWL
ncbi:MAG: DUF2029 domain-containing protein, partial [Lachnospiraceae bacterium]|nr:DUF2029 domain-containing protein [Lachnospiraceae bacterium]